MSLGVLATGGGVIPNWNDFVIKHFEKLSSILTQIVAGKRAVGNVKIVGSKLLFEVAFATDE